MSRRVLLSCIALVVSACSTPPAFESPARWRRWSLGYGGVVDDDVHRPRAERALAALRVFDLERRAHVRVLDHGAAAAFAWRSGDVFVTRGLVELLDDAELAAALAHEIGHLLAESREGLDPGDERVADGLGREILSRSGFPPGTMQRMLRTLGERGGPILAESLRERIHWLELAPTVDADVVAMQ